MSNAALPKGFYMTPPHVWSLIYRPRRFSAWLHRRYGDAVTFYGPGSALVMTLTSKGAHQILAKNFDVYEAFQKQAFAGLAGRGSLFVLDGLRHRRERNLLLPAFHAQRLRQYGQAIQDITRLHTDAWQPGQHLRACDSMIDISRDVIQHVVLGIEHGSRLDESRRVLARMLDAAHPLLEYIALFQAWWFRPWARFQAAKREFSCFVRGRIAERRALGSDSEDLLALMLTAQYDDGTLMSDDDIHDELYTILLPGHATTATALTWALYELGRHPAILARLRKELDAIGPDPEPDLIVKQPYLNGVCNETLRLHTIVTEVARLARAPFELLDHAIPVGAAVGISISAIHQDPALYPEPDRFLPERFLDRSYGPSEFLPFGGGHRRCLGAALSDYEMRIVLAGLVAHWEYELTGEEREIRHNLGMGPKHGVRIRLTKRRRSGGVLDTRDRSLGSR